MLLKDYVFLGVLAAFGSYFVFFFSEFYQLRTDLKAQFPACMDMSGARQAALFFGTWLTVSGAKKAVTALGSGLLERRLSLEKFPAGSFAR